MIPYYIPVTGTTFVQSTTPFITGTWHIPLYVTNLQEVPFFIPPPKNWRWFDVFRVVLPVESLIGRVMAAAAMRRLLMPRLAERRRQKRRLFIQMLAGSR